MREFSVPAIAVASPTTRTSPTRCSPTPRATSPTRRLPPPRRRRRVDRRHGRGVRRPGHRGRRGPDRRGRRAGRPGRAAVRAPATSGRWSTTRSSPSGAVTVPIYETSSAGADRAGSCPTPGAVAVVVETDEHAALVEQVRDELLGLRTSGRSSPTADRPGAVERADRARRRRAGRRRCTSAARRCRADDLATLIYTSGTTGRPKGCELTHRNLQSPRCARSARLFPELLTAGGSVLLFLPLAHVFGKAIQCGAT